MNKTVIIAEAGVNHNGDIQLAKQLIDVAADAGVDYVKFQTFKADKLVSKEAKQADYQLKNLGGNSIENSQYNMLKKLELTESMHVELLKYAKQKGVKFLSTGFDEDSIDFLEQLGIDLYKIPSGEITNFPYLQHIARKRKPIVISTGMATLGEIEEALSVLKGEGVDLDKVTVLHCNTDYPTKYEDVNLNAMLTIQQAFKVNIGYSDHTLGIEVPVAAVALGAKVIEKHFTLDRDLPGPDHKASLEPDELKAMVSAIRNIEKAINGDGRKEPTSSELKNKDLARKSLHVKVNLEVGDEIGLSDLEVKRPGSGISSMYIPRVVGRKVVKPLQAGEILDWSHIQ
ncbi:N-acetylneuraminate synthase [Pontibacter akesuensis]|uniref:N-acetylneuraminate synthase n=1 Tax=Pontibacter akesuensis TaxID=388950 RepID=A0A1I7H5V5_9BACT|nr:N-acetylneuraminate synthase [Pontibacter akesuensis]GHA53244.1 N-acetylneuraminate synthase [Pontibacter akesuensis]SFU56065.1 N-acetylneuraminate synthase [Pontibacter akesuensis]